MKILFISSSPLEYTASANMRNLALLKGIEKLGHEIYTLTPEYQTDMKKYDPSICDLNFNKRYWIKLGNFHQKITMKKGKKNYIKSILYKLLTKIRIYDFKARLVDNLSKIEIDEKFDYIISSSDPKSSHLLAEKLIALNPGITKKWIQYWGDPFADDINKSSIIPKFVIKKEEKRLISLCDKVIYVSPFTLKKQKRLYECYSDKMFFLPIPFLKEKIYPETTNKKILLGYYGDYNKKDRNIFPLYDTIKSQTDNFEMKICGASDLNLENHSNIEIQERQTVDVIQKYEKNTDILICICNKSGTQIPGKVYHYAATNKPILIIVDGDNKEELKEYFESFNRYYLCDNNELSILNKLNEIKSQRNVSFNPCEQFKPINIAKEFLNN